MRSLVASLAIVLALASAGAWAAERHPRAAPDECTKRGAACEKGCDAKAGTERLSCKTDCRLTESQCRNGKR